MEWDPPGYFYYTLTPVLTRERSITLVVSSKALKEKQLGLQDVQYISERISCRVYEPINGVKVISVIEKKHSTSAGYNDQQGFRVGVGKKHFSALALLGW